MTAVKLKALTIKQPFASRIMDGLKPIEYRTRSTRYRGPLAIHAAKPPHEGLPVSAILGTIDLIDCEHDPLDGVWMWRLAHPRPLATPIPCKGALSLWTVPAEIAELLLAPVEARQ